MRKKDTVPQNNGKKTCLSIGKSLHASGPTNKVWPVKSDSSANDSYELDLDEFKFFTEWTKFIIRRLGAP